MSDAAKAEALLNEIPEPDTIRSWLARAIRQAQLLRSLLRVAERKASYRERPPALEREAAQCNG